MWKIILLIIIVAIVDLRKISFKEKKKEVVIYFILFIMTIGLAIYYNNPKHLTLSEFALRFMP